MEDYILVESHDVYSGNMVDGMEIVYYSTREGKCPYLKWVNGLDSTARARIDNRLVRIKTKGHFGATSAIVNHPGLFEIKLNEFRIYYTKRDNLVILLLGGDKDDQARDIRRASNLIKEIEND